MSLLRYAGPRSYDANDDRQLDDGTYSIHTKGSDALPRRSGDTDGLVGYAMAVQDYSGPNMVKEIWVLFDTFKSPTVSLTGECTFMEIRGVRARDIHESLSNYRPPDPIPEPTFIAAVQAVAAARGQTCKVLISHSER